MLPLGIKESGFNHTISGRLLSYGEPVLQKQVKVYVNDTLKANLTTHYPDGGFSLTLNLQPVDSRPTTYNVQAVFEGSEPSNMTAYAFTPNGTRYAACTTIQYGYRPASNMTILTVRPHATDVLTTAKRTLSSSNCPLRGASKNPRTGFLGVKLRKPL